MLPTKRPSLQDLRHHRAGRLTLLRLLTPGIGLLLDFLITSQVGRDGLGTYALFVSVAAVISMVAALGIPAPLNRELAILEPSQGQGRSQLVASALAVTTIVWAAMALPPILFGAQALSWWREQVAEASTLDAVFIAVLALGLASQGLAVAVGRGYDRLTIATLADLVMNKVVLVAALAAMALGWLPATTSTLFVAAMIAGFAPLAAVFAWIGGRGGLRPARPDLAVGWRMASQSKALLAHQVVLSIGSSVALWMLASRVSDDEVAMFYLLTRFAALVAVPGIVVQFLYGNRVAEAHANGTVAELQPRLTRAVQLSSSIALALALAIFVGHGIVMRVVAGTVVGWTYAVPLAILIASFLVQVATGPCGYALIMAKRESTILLATAAGTISAVVTGALLIAPFGLTGAALASAAGIVVTNVLNLVYSRRQVGLDTSLVLARSTRHSRGGNLR